ncbi:MAG: Flp pilus assembly complex ATPase component TadA [Magnetococcales bacterium]|nr:Flp pilus assembly complex ATPase component TadA [Magnetococcales bacterium]
MSEITHSHIGVAVYLGLHASLTDSAAIKELNDALTTCMDAREMHVVLDFANVPLISSRALEDLLDAQDSISMYGGEIRITNLNNVVRDVLRLTEIDRHIQVMEDQEFDDDGYTIAQAPKKLGELLVERGHATEKQVEEAIKLQSATGKRMGHILVAKRIVSEKDLLEILSEQLSIPLVHLRTGLYDQKVVAQLRPEHAARLRVLPLFRIRDVIYLATADPQAIPSFDAVEEMTGCKVKPVLSLQDQINKVMEAAYASGTDDSGLSALLSDLDVTDDIELVDEKVQDHYLTIDQMAAGSPVINLINGIIQRAVGDGASDIHIEPDINKCRIRVRIDGILYQIMTPPKEIYPALISRLKVMAGADISERRLPQDGRIQVMTQGRRIDLRFSSLPGILGEKIVLRILDRTQAVKDLADLSMPDDILLPFKESLGRSNGLILVTGPTGSGKTTTLYSALKQLNSIEKNIITIEDPVEYQMDVINQVQVKSDIGLTFSTVLKHVLRQDPDIVMVGEIREQETAEIAVQAALTGHLVLSTLHTNDSAGAITRLLDMGVEPFLLSSALVAVMAQRLLRSVCPDCKTTTIAPPGSLAEYGVEEQPGEKIRLIRGRGCPSCYDSGYKGRVAVHELLVADASTQQLVMNNPSRDALNAHLAERQVTTLMDSGVDKALRGLTTFEEVKRIVNV